MNAPAVAEPTTPAGLTVQGVAAAIVARIDTAPVRRDPFPHIVVDDVLPPQLRQALDGYWPPAESLSASNHFRRSERQVSALAKAAQDRERRFWTGLQMVAREVSRTIRRRFERHLPDKFRPLAGPDWRRRLGAPGYLDQDAMLAHYTGRVELAPHVDHARVVINGFVYLDDPGQVVPEPLRGTMLYRSLGFAWPSNTPIPKAMRDHYLREAVDVGWRDNRLLAYVNGPWSFHGVPAHELGEGRRRLLMFGSVLDKATAARILDEPLR